MLNHKVGSDINWSNIKDLHTIGIDEIRNRKGHKDFLAIISSKDKYDNLRM